MFIKGAIIVKNEIDKEIVPIKEDILEMKEEIFKLNNLIIDIIKELKRDSNMKIEDKDSKEIENILSNCLNEF